MELRSHRFFSHFPSPQGAQLVRICKLMRIPGGTMLFEEDDKPDAIYLVLTGRVALTKRVAGGHQQTIAYAGPDDYFGELGVLDGSGRSLSAMTQGPVLLARVPQKPFIQILSKSPWHTLLRLFSHISENLRATNERFVTEVVRKEKITLIGEMANGMIHDFRNPFTSIRLAVEMMAKKHRDADTQNLCRVVMRQLTRLSGMVEEVLEFARGDTRLVRRAVPLNKLFAHLSELNTDNLQTTHTRLVIRPTPLVVPLDFDRFTRVLQNLLYNSLEAIGPTRRGRIVIAAKPVHGGCIIKVQDNGPGIPEEIQDSAFEPFVSHGKPGGTGLGLAIARSLVETHGGTISFTCTKAGTTFHIHLPCSTLARPGRIPPLAQ
ncbi:MAG: ATP-binding protein [Opitutaceae bacterium]|nr:ATP-binding protein [Opitutaceae bacterium]